MPLVVMTRLNYVVTKPMSFSHPAYSAILPILSFRNILSKDEPASVQERFDPEILFCSIMP